MSEQRAKIVRVLRGEHAGAVVRLLARAGEHEVIVKRPNGAENLRGVDVEFIEQEPPYPQIFHLVPFSKRGSVQLRDENGLHVGIVQGTDAHLLAAAPALLDLVERLLPWLDGGVPTIEEDGGKLIKEAKAAIDFLRRERLECEECIGLSSTCEACAGLGILVGGPEQT